jgi:transcriptional regulator with XRE-family HTH domain
MIFKPESLAPAIRAGRNALGWSQKELAEKSGISVPTIARTEISNNPKLDTVLAIIGALKENGVVFRETDTGFEMTVNFLPDA